MPQTYESKITSNIVALLVTSELQPHKAYLLAPHLTAALHLAIPLGSLIPALKSKRLINALLRHDHLSSSTANSKQLCFLIAPNYGSI